MLRNLLRDMLIIQPLCRRIYFFNRLLRELLPFAPFFLRAFLRTCLRSDCDAVIGANALLEILIYTRKLRFLRPHPANDLSLQIVNRF